MVVSQIREMTRLAMEHGAINLGQGLPEIEPPATLLEQYAQIDGVFPHQYTNTWGEPTLRAALAELYGRKWGRPIDPEREVTISVGVSAGVTAAVLAAVDPGDDVIVFEPAHENYIPAVRFAGAEPVLVPLEPPDFILDAARVRAAIGPRTRAVILNTPHNPTGRVFTRDELEPLAALCIEHDLTLITDEIYDDLVYEGEHIPPATLPGMAERTIAVLGLGKSYSVTGWRLGHAIAPPELTAAIRQVHEYMNICAPSPLQYAAARALPAMQPDLPRIRTAYRERRDAFIPALQELGFACRLPEGAYYVMADVSPLGFADDVTAARVLVEQARVAAVPGSSFYPGRPHLGRKLLRFAFCKQQATLDEALNRLRAFQAQRA